MANSLSIYCQYAAKLLADHIQKRFEEEIKKAHQAAYEQGWKDAKSKRKKCKNFVCHLGNIRPVVRSAELVIVLLKLHNAEALNQLTHQRAQDESFSGL